MKEEMTEGERVHFLTEGIYRNLLDNFNPGIKQLISTGRAFQKALHNVASSAKTYIDSIYSLAQGAQLCKGATSEIGAALLQIAEVHKEINTQVIDNIKSFHAELLIPLETKQESEMKQIHLIHKKYLAGHKYHSGPLEKSQSALRKQRKKSKAAKYGYDQKEFQISRDVKECQARLDEYRVQSLRQAFLEERKRYCFLLDRIIAMVRNYASHHSKAQELLTHRLNEWTDIGRHPHMLPPATESVVKSFRVHQDDVYTNPSEDNTSGIAEFDRQASDPERTSMYGHSGPPSLTYGTANGLYNTGQDDVYATRAAMAIPHSVQPSRPRVRALYSHTAHGETQLSFVEGDIIALIGEQREGWHYGENLSTHRRGWLPIAFTHPIQGARGMHQRVHSLGNLMDRLPPEHDPQEPTNLSEGEGTLRRSNTIHERPKSIHGRVSMPGREPGMPSPNKLADTAWSPLPVEPSQRPLPARPGNDFYNYQHKSPYHHQDDIQSLDEPQRKLSDDDIPTLDETRRRKWSYPGSVPDMNMLPHESPYSLPPPNSMPPLPPPPPPPPPSESMPPPPPRPPEAEYGHVGFGHVGGQPPLPPGHPLGVLPDQQPYKSPSPPTSSSGYSGSSNRAHQSSSGSHYSGGGQSSGGFPPPPPPLSPPAPPPPPSTSDYEEPPSNMFQNVQLKKAQTNDRSAPKIIY